MTYQNSDYDVTVIVFASEARPKVALTQELVRAYGEALTDLGKTYEVVFVDDGVGGEYLQLVEKMCREQSNVRAIRFRRSFGESVGIASAVGLARGRLIFTTTWYQQVGVDAIRLSLDLLENHRIDYVAVRRERRVDSWFARLQSWAFNSYTRFLTKADLRDLNCSFRAFRREVVDELSFHGDLFRFIAVFAIQKGFRVVEVPVQHLREEGPSTLLTPGVYIRRLLDILSLFFLIKFTRKPLRFFGMVGSVFFVIGMVICLGLVWLNIIDRKYPLAEKPQLILGVFLLVLGIIVGSIGLIGEIIIFLQGRELRDYHIERVITGGDESQAAS